MKKICKYFDIPIQHISDRVLKRMNRQTTGQNIKNTIKKIKRQYSWSSNKNDCNGWIPWRNRGRLSEAI